MDYDAFWNLIHHTKQDSSGNPRKQARLLVEALVKLPEQDILDYDRIYDELADRAYTADLCAAAGGIDSWGCTDDGFIDFRAWLIAQVKLVYVKTRRVLLMWLM